MKPVLVFILFLAIHSFSIAQEKTDLIVKTNGEEVKCKVTEVTETEVKFTYAGESVVYTVSKADIARIVFASGRTEVFNGGGQAAPATAGGGSSDSRNKVAILPITYIMNGQRAVHELSEKVQQETFAYMQKHAGIYQYQDPRTTNALLIKAGVTVETVKGFTPDEICKILGVEYTIEGIMTLDPKSQTSYQSSNYNSKDSYNKQGNNRTNYSGSTSSTSMQNYQTTMMLSVFNEKGNTVFSQERTSFWSTRDAYKSTLEYLLKKTPLYSK